ncbi:hypothetical protein [Oricola indica]|uniref:hypothetical protein n=1 Tax=Oricola indica TaxID=2872591 RepID=UPI003CCBED95
MEDAFIAVADRLQAGGMSPEQVATELINAAADAHHPFATDIRHLAAWAMATG